MWLLCGFVQCACPAPPHARRGGCLRDVDGMGPAVQRSHARRLSIMLCPFLFLSFVDPPFLLASSSSRVDAGSTPRPRRPRGTWTGCPSIGAAACKLAGGPISNGLGRAPYAAVVVVPDLVHDGVVAPGSPCQLLLRSVLPARCSVPGRPLGPVFSHLEAKSRAEDDGEHGVVLAEQSAGEHRVRRGRSGGEGEGVPNRAGPVVRARTCL